MTTIDSTAALAEGLSCEVLTPEDPGYDAARSIHNGLIEWAGPPEPAPTSSADQEVDGSTSGEARADRRGTAAC